MTSLGNVLLPRDSDRFDEHSIYRVRLTRSMTLPADYCGTNRKYNVPEGCRTRSQSAYEQSKGLLNGALTRIRQSPRNRCDKSGCKNKSKNIKWSPLYSPPGPKQGICGKSSTNIRTRSPSNNSCNTTSTYRISTRLLPLSSNDCGKTNRQRYGVEGSSKRKSRSQSSQWYNSDGPITRSMKKKLICVGSEKTVRLKCSGIRRTSITRISKKVIGKRKKISESSTRNIDIMSPGMHDISIDDWENSTFLYKNLVENNFTTLNPSVLKDVSFAYPRMTEKNEIIALIEFILNTVTSAGYIDADAKDRIVYEFANTFYYPGIYVSLNHWLELEKYIGKLPKDAINIWRSFDLNKNVDIQHLCQLSTLVFKVDCKKCSMIYIEKTPFTLKEAMENLIKFCNRRKVHAATRCLPRDWSSHDYNWNRCQIVATTKEELLPFRYEIEKQKLLELGYHVFNRNREVLISPEWSIVWKMTFTQAEYLCYYWWECKRPVLNNKLEEDEAGGYSYDNMQSRGDTYGQQHYSMDTYLEQDANYFYHRYNNSDQNHYLPIEEYNINETNFFKNDQYAATNSYQNENYDETNFSRNEHYNITNSYCNRYDSTNSNQNKRNVHNSSQNEYNDTINIHQNENYDEINASQNKHDDITFSSENECNVINNPSESDDTNNYYENNQYFTTTSSQTRHYDTMNPYQNDQNVACNSYQNEQYERTNYSQNECVSTTNCYQHYVTNNYYQQSHYNPLNYYQNEYYGSTNPYQNDPHGTRNPSQNEQCSARDSYQNVHFESNSDNQQRDYQYDDNQYNP